MRAYLRGKHRSSLGKYGSPAQVLQPHHASIMKWEKLTLLDSTKFNLLGILNISFVIGEKRRLLTFVIISGIIVRPKMGLGRLYRQIATSLLGEPFGTFETFLYRRNGTRDAIVGEGGGE
jgi:hypothetical protein